MIEQNVLSRSEILSKLVRSPAAMAGIIIILVLVFISIYAAVAVPRESYNQWNNPTYWQDFPKTVPPVWTGLFASGNGGVTPSMVFTIGDAAKNETASQGSTVVTYTWKIDYGYNSFPNGFVFSATAKYSRLPVIQLDIVRPDGKDFKIYYYTLPPPSSGNSTAGVRILSTDSSIAANMANYVSLFNCSVDPSKPQIMAFSDTQNCKALNGTYSVTATVYFFGFGDSVQDMRLIIPGQVYGLMGTDDYGRDLSIGILWGAPVALFIGLTVAIASTFIGLFYGVIAGYKGRYADEGMMRTNDIFYSLPALPLLIILSVSIGRSIFLFVGFFVLFGWVGMAKIGRSLALQIKNLQYVEAAKLMGESDFRIITKHIIPQLLPIAFASMAVAVPAAILGEAALSFLGLGDPSIPTWGRILHDANSAGAIVRGLWWWTLIPGFMIALTGTAFVLIGNTLNTIVNPRSTRNVIKAKRKIVIK